MYMFGIHLFIGHTCSLNTRESTVIHVIFSAPTIRQTDAVAPANHQRPAALPVTTTAVTATVGQTPNRRVFARHGGCTYRKIRGRAYKSYWLCEWPGCRGQIVLNDLRGGTASPYAPHAADCQRSAAAAAAGGDVDDDQQVWQLQ